MRQPYLLHGYLARSAATNPDKPAVIDRDRSLTYQELHQRSGAVASQLTELGVGPGDRVGIYMAKSLEAVVAVYGVMRAGAAYVPMDSSAPVSRVGYIADNCEMSVVITEPRLERNWEELTSIAGEITHLAVFEATEVDEVGSAGVTRAEADIDVFDDPPVIGDDLAYILYTSGSTGQPKGVMLSHENCRAFVQWAVEELGVTADDRLSSHAPFHFDLSTFDLYAAAAVGATLVLVPPRVSVFPVEVVRFIEENEISVWYSVPSILTMMVERADLSPGALPSLKTVLFAGEVFPSKHLSRLMKLVPHADFFNLYGPTETNVCTWYRVPEPPGESDPPISIGSAIRNVETFVVGKDGSEVSPGTVGELLVRGATVMKGYWGDPERTAERLTPSTLERHRGDLVYHTGDLVEEMPDGNYRFLGRRDNQVKSRGYRIELGDIESAVSTHPDVVECGVVAVPDEIVTNRIVAFVSVAAEVSEDELKSFCADLVPKYMVPERFSILEMLPKTSTGKLDRQGLLDLSA